MQSVPRVALLSVFSLAQPHSAGNTVWHTPSTLGDAWHLCNNGNGWNPTDYTGKFQRVVHAGLPYSAGFPQQSGDAEQRANALSPQLEHKREVIL